MKNLLLIISRLIVGSLFIVSGLIKANDAHGFEYKLIEYFGERALGLEFMIPAALGLAIFICVGEILLGVALLLGALPRLTNILLMIMILFFSWLTYYTANCDPFSEQEFVNSAGETYTDAPDCVLECGCFGNAIPLTPWESFYKDMFLLVFIVITFIGTFVWDKIKLNTAKEDIIYVTGSLVLVALFSLMMLEWTFPVLFTAATLGIGILIKRYYKFGGKEIMMAVGVTIVCLLFQFHTLNHLPMKDYRAYAIGKSIKDGILSAEDKGLTPPKYVNIYELTNESTGEKMIMNSDDYISKEIWKDKSWKITKTFDDPVKLEDGYEPPIPNWPVESLEGEDMVQAILSGGDFVFLHVSYNLDKSCGCDMKAMTDFANRAIEDGNRFVGLTSSGEETIEQFRFDHQCQYPFYTSDEKVLKTMVRSNPGLMVLKDGVVINKWSHSDIPDYGAAASSNFNPY